MQQDTLRPLQGFSMVELLVAVALSLLMLGGVVTIFSTTRNSYLQASESYEAAEAGRMALTLLIESIQTAGFLGCSSGAPVHSSLKADSDAQRDFFLPPVYAYDGGKMQNEQFLSPDDLPSNVSEDSDVLVVRGPRRDAQSVELRSTMGNPSEPMRVTSASSATIKAGDIAMIFSCEARSFFYVTTFENGLITHDTTPEPVQQPGNATRSIGYAFRSEAEILPVQIVTYYVGTNAAGHKSLWRRIGRGTPTEIVPGIEKMVLKFGLDARVPDIETDYRAAASISDWSIVRSVEISLLAKPAESMFDTRLVLPSEKEHPSFQVTAVASIRNYQ